MCGFGNGFDLRNYDFCGQVSVLEDVAGEAAFGTRIAEEDTLGGRRLLVGCSEGWGKRLSGGGNGLFRIVGFHQADGD